MPTYAYKCAGNGQVIEVRHSIKDDLKTWGELCDRAELPLGDTPAEAEVERILFAPSLATPKGAAELKNLGFTKLVRRDKGVYENVTATGNEKRYMTSDDPSSVPDLKGKISS